MNEKVVVTVDHGEILNWAKKHNAIPQIIDDPDAGSDDIGIRFDVPGREDDQFLSSVRLPRSISWGEFFDRFEQMQLAFVYRKGADDKSGLSYMFIKRGTEIPSRIS